MLTERFGNALNYAFFVHRVHVRKGTSVPYIAHLMEVAAIVLTHGGDEDEAIGALLHDAAEDGGGRPRLEDITARFGDAVAAIVEGCTDTFDSPKPEWTPRKRAYVARLEHESRAVLLVSAADKLANARAVLTDFRALGDAVFSRFTGGKAGTLWYYRTLVDAYRARGSAAPAAIVDELDRSVTELERLACGVRDARHRLRDPT
jgi:GTP pyrophosphokinase